MRIRKRRPTATSAGGDPSPPPPPPPPQQCHVKAESRRSDLIAASVAAAAAAASASKNLKSSSTTSAATTATSALHYSCTFNNMSLLIMGKQREAAFTPMQVSRRRNTVATSQSAGGPRVLDHMKKKARVNTRSEEEMMKFCRLSSNDSSFRPPVAAAAALARLTGQIKHELDEDINVESELGGIPRHIPSNWAMPSLQGLRRSRSRSTSKSNSMQKPQNDALAGTNNGHAYNVQDEAQIISMSSRLSDDGSIMQGVQQACRQTLNWPEAEVDTAGPYSRLSFTRIHKEIATLEQMKVKMDVQAGKIKRKLEEDRSVDHNYYTKADDQKREPLRSSIFSSGGPKQQPQMSDKGKRSLQGAVGKNNDYIGRYGIKAHGSQFAAQNGSDQINQQEESVMVSKCNKSSIKSGTAAATRENGVGDGEAVEDQQLHTSTSCVNMVGATGMNNIIISKKLERADTTIVAAAAAAAAAGSDSLGKESSSKNHNIGNRINMDHNEAWTTKKKLGGGRGGGGDGGGVAGSAGIITAAGTSRRRKKCRPAFRSINDIQRRAPLIHDNNNDSYTDHHHRHAATRDQIDHIIDGPASSDDPGDTTQPDRASTTTLAYSTATVNNSSTAAASDSDSRLLDVHYHRDGDKTNEDVVLTKMKKLKMNNLTMTIMGDVVADARGGRPLLVSRPSYIKSCKAAHHPLKQASGQYVQVRRQPGAPGPHDGAAAASHLPPPAAGLQLMDLDTSSPAHPHRRRHQGGDCDSKVVSQPINCSCSLNSDPLEWRPDFSHFM